MFEDDNKSTEFGELFMDDPEAEPEVEAEETEAEEETSETEESEESDESQESEDEEEHQTEESEEEDTEEEEKKEDDGIVATIEIDGKEFPLDEMKVQKLAEQYVNVANINKQLQQDRERVNEALQYIDNVRNGVDIDEAMTALGVNFDALIHDKVKDFIRRSTMSAKEREYEDAAKERDKLRQKIAEREQKEREEKEAQQGKEQANVIIESVNNSLADIPEKFRKEIQIEVFGAIERRLRAGDNRPSAAAIKNAVNTIYKRKYKSIYETEKKSVTSKRTSPPKPVKNNPGDSTLRKKSAYNATDYNELF